MGTHQLCPRVPEHRAKGIAELQHFALGVEDVHAVTGIAQKGLVALKAVAQDTIAHFEVGAAFGNTLFQRRVCSDQRVLEAFALNRVAQRSHNDLRV